MANDLDIKGAVTLDSTNAEQGLARVEKAAKKTADAAARAGKDAGKSFEGIGDGAGPASQKIERSTTSIIQAIQRTTAAAKAGQKGTADYFEELAKQRGVSGDALKPYIESLRQVEAAQKKAEQGLGAGAASLDRVGMSAKATAAAMRNVPAQFQDIVVSLQGGQAPMTVLLQQGSQLSGMFGGAGQAAKALGTYVLGLINPVTVAAAAFAALGFAMASVNGKDNELASLSVRLKATGRDSLASVTDIKKMVAELNQIPGVTKSAAMAIIDEFSKVQGVGGTLFRNLSASVADFAAATGTELPAAAKKLATAFADPAKGARDLDAALGTLTASQILTVEKLAEMGDKAGAQAALLDALKGATQGLANEGMTPLGRASENLANSWSILTTTFGQSDSIKAANNILANMINTAAQLAVKLSSLRLPDWLGKSFSGGLNGMVFGAMGSGGSSGGATGSWGEPSRGASGSFAPDKAEEVSRHKAVIDSLKGFESQAGAMEKLRNTAKQAKEALAELESQNKGGTIEATKLRDGISGLNEKLAEMAKRGKKTGDGGVKAEQSAYGTLIASINQKIEAERMELSNTAKLTESQKIRIKMDAEMTAGKLKLSAAHKAEAIAALESLRGLELRKQAQASEKVYDDERRQIAEEQAAAYVAQSKALEAGRAALMDYVRSVDESNEQAQIELSFAGMAETAREIAIGQYKVELELKRQIAAIDKSGGYESEAQRETDRAQARDAAAKASAGVGSRVILEEQRKTNDTIRSTLADALMRGFESGESAAENLKNTVVNMFKTMILRPTVSAIVNPLAGAVTSVMSGGGSSGGGIMGSLGGFSGALGMGLKAGFSALMGESGIMGALSAGMTSIGTATASGLAAGLGTIAGALGPIALGIGLVSSLLSGKKDSRYGAAYSFTQGAGTQIVGGPNRGVDFANQGAVVNSVANGINALLGKLGSSEKLAQFGAAFESSVKGRGFTYAGGQLSSGATFGQQSASNNRGSKTVEEAMAQYQTELKQATLQALQAAGDVPKFIRNQLEGVNLDSLGSGDLDKLIAVIDAQIVAVDQFRIAAATLPFENLKKLSFDAASGLLSFAGGIENLSSNLTTYLDNFYSEEERRQIKIKQINSATAGTGFDAGTASKQNFRSMVEAQDLSTESGQKTYAMLIGVAGAFASLSKDGKTAGDIVAKAKQDLIEAYKREADSMGGVVEKFRAFSKDLRAFRDGLLTGGLSPLTPGQKYAAAGADFDRLMGTIRNGTTEEKADANSRLQGAANSLLEASKAYNASGAAFIMDFERVRAGFDEAAIQAAATADVSQLQLDAAQAQLAALGSIDSNILSLGEAINNLADAKRIAGQMPAFANGGDHKGGWAMVGEQGPERVYLPPARIFNAGDMSRMDSTSGTGVESRLDAIVVQLDSLRRQQSQETGATITANYDANRQNAESVAAAQAKLAWAKNQKVALE